MKSIALIIALLFVQNYYSQFNRTFFNIDRSALNYQNLVQTNALQQTIITTFAPSLTGSFEIKKQTINNDGDVIAASTNDYTIPIGDFIIFSVLGCNEINNNIYYILQIKPTNTNFTILYLKIDSNTGSLMQYFIGPQNNSKSQIEAYFNANSCITYRVGMNKDLIRTEFELYSFSVVSEEIVGSNYNLNVNQNQIINGFVSGKIVFINGLERLIVKKIGSQSFEIISRNGPANYSFQNTNITGANVNAYTKNNQLIITDGAKVEHYSGNGTLIASYQFSVPFSRLNNLVVEKGSDIYIFSSDVYFQKPTICYKANSNYVVTDSCQSTVYGIQKCIVSSNQLVILGADYKIKDQLSCENSTECMGHPIYCEKFSTMPKLESEEYISQISSHNSLLNVGLGTSVVTPLGYITEPNSLSKISTIFSHQEQIIGFTNSNDTLINFSEEIRSHSYPYIIPGPFTNHNQYSVLVESNYNRSYRVTKQMIQNHINAVQSGNSNYIAPFGIKKWPAHGDINIGQAQNLAPFVDVNQNGIYEPMLGDYPKIYGEDCIFNITHIRCKNNPNVGVELHSYIYTQKCDTSDLYDDVFLRKLKIISKGVDLDSLFLGIYNDTDLGNYNDDYIGTNVDIGLQYYYNGDLIDENNAGHTGFHDTLATSGTLILKGFKQDDDGIDNSIGIQTNQTVNGFGFDDGIVDNEFKGLYSTNFYYTNLQNSSIISMVHNQMNGLNVDGTTLYHCQNTNFPTKYSYTKDNDSLYYGTDGIDPNCFWTMLTPTGIGSTPYPAGDVRVYMSFGKSKLAANQSIDVEYALLSIRENSPSTNVFEPLETLFEKSSMIRKNYLNNEGPCNISWTLSNPTDSNNEDMFRFYPNPSTGQIKITSQNNSVMGIQVFNTNGILVEKRSDVMSNETINLNHLSANLYLIKISNGKKTEVKKFIKL